MSLVCTQDLFSPGAVSVLCLRTPGFVVRGPRTRGACGAPSVQTPVGPPTPPNRNWAVPFPDGMAFCDLTGGPSLRVAEGREGSFSPKGRCWRLVPRETGRRVPVGRSAGKIKSPTPVRATLS